MGDVFDIGKFGDAIKVAIEKVYDIGTGIAKPYQMKRIANAEMDIEDERERRAIIRFTLEEMRKQTNLENIMQRAIPYITENAQPENVDPDWTANTIDKCKLTSDEDMQDFWAKILAGEINTPGTFSKRTVNFVAEMDKTDAELFTKLCSFIWNLGTNIPLLYEASFDIYAKYGLSFDKIQHLADIGLVAFLVTGQAGADIKEDTLLPVSYHKNSYRLKLPKTPRSSLGPMFGFNLGKLKLTKIGYELAPIANGQPIPEFLDHTLTMWIQQEYFVRSDYPKTG